MVANHVHHLLQVSHPVSLMTSLAQAVPQNVARQHQYLGTSEKYLPPR